MLFFHFITILLQPAPKTRWKCAENCHLEFSSRLGTFDDVAQVCGPRMQIATESRYRTHVLAASSPASFSSRRDFCRRRAENWSACNFQAVNSSRPAVNAPESVRLLRFSVFSRVARIFARIHSTRRFAPAAEGGGRGGGRGRGVQVFSRCSRH